MRISFRYLLISARYNTHEYKILLCGRDIYISD